MTRISNRTRFLFGAAIGAWLNIWTPVFGTIGPVIFAYILMFVCLWSASIGDFVKKDKA